ncbi:tetratricopeptide repeat protein [bacterium]|nr:tetratricopeptide repeat protein [bacterium]
MRSPSDPEDIRNLPLSHRFRTRAPKTGSNAILIAFGSIVAFLQIAGCSPYEPTEAEKWLKAVEAKPPDTGPGWQDAYVRFRDNAGDLEAAATIRAYVERNPQSDSGLMALGLVERDLGRFEEADACYRRVIEINPTRAGAFWNLGRIAQGKGDLDSAAQFFESARKCDSLAWQPIYALSQLRRQQGKADEARALWDEAKARGAGKSSERGGMGGYETDIGIVYLNMEWD